jgi:subtilisin
MFKLKLLALSFFAAALSISCSDDSEETKSKNAEECLTIKSSTSGQVVEGEYIVGMPSSDSSGRMASVETILKDNGVQDPSILSSFEGRRSYYLMKLSEAEAENLRHDDRITNVEPDRIISVCGCFSVLEPRSVTWNVDQVGYGDGTGKTAWILDTGIDSDHGDLNVDKNRSRSFLQDNSSYEDDNGHGTHIGGIIGALNNTIGTLGIASGATLVGLKVLDKNGDGKLSGLLNALAYVKSNGKAGDVVNISIGFPEESQILEDEIRSIAAKEIYFALAAGNESAPASDYSPARTAGKNIYTVTAVDSANTFAAFSNYGNDVVDFAAPGVNILSTFTNGRYATLSGTSMAAPHVAGLLLINDGKINSSGSAVGDPDGVGDPLAHK